MKIHEFQAKELFRKAGVAVLRGIVARTPDEAAAAFNQLGGQLAVVKAQIHAGGRGKGTIKDNPQQRGVQLVQSRRRSGEGRREPARQDAGHDSDRARRARRSTRCFVEEGCDIARELYLGIVVDRAAAKPVLMVSQRRRHEHREGRRRDAAS